MGAGPAGLAWGGDAREFSVEWAEDWSPPDEPFEGSDGRSVSLALPLLAHIVTAHGGSIDVTSRGGLVVRLTWPRVREVAASA